MTPFDLLPPPELLARRGGSPDARSFLAGGRELFRRALAAGLRADHRVLDLGCGCGQFALPLLNYLDRRGGYDGIDVHADSIDWAADAITVNYPNFRFLDWDVRHPVDRPRGRRRPHQARLPFAARTFDFIVAAGTAGRLLPRGLRCLVAELNRVLKPGGSCLMTFDLVSPDQPDPRFPFLGRQCAVRDEVRPEEGVAHDPEAVAVLFRRCGFAEPVVARVRLPGGRALLTTAKQRELSGWERIRKKMASWDVREESLEFRRVVVSAHVAARAA